ncbi:MAG: phosphotransferase [Tagaea sp.]|nr:phosphotransferase [Tagaea sp.]
MSLDAMRPRKAARLFLDAQGWAGIEAVPLAGDASFRKYFRLTDGARRAVLMDAPPPLEDVRPFAKLAVHLRGLGLSAPHIEAADAHAGFLLLEDFGDDTFARALAAGASEAELYAAATDVLIALHAHPAQAHVDCPAYDAATLDREAALLIDWFLPEWSERPLAPDARAAYFDAWRRVYPLAAIGGSALVLRDFHIDNLIRLPRAGVAACGLLDFQDALIGSPAYDLASLIGDARRDVSPAVARACVERYLASRPGLDARGFEAALAVLSAQRNAKIAGIFVRLARRDGKPHYLRHIDRVWRLLDCDLAHPALEPVRAWFERHVPRDWRARPKVPA